MKMSSCVPHVKRCMAYKSTNATADTARAAAARNKAGVVASAATSSLP